MYYLFRQHFLSTYYEASNVLGTLNMSHFILHRLSKQALFYTRKPRSREVRNLSKLTQLVVEQNERRSVS